jgi:hypothetical protein
VPVGACVWVLQQESGSIHRFPATWAKRSHGARALREGRDGYTGKGGEAPYVSWSELNSSNSEGSTTSEESVACAASARRVMATVY